MRWLRKPPVHFVAIGVALFAVERYATPLPKAERPTVTITAARLAQLEGDSRRSTDVALDREALLERAIEEEVLYREAVARGLDREDPLVRGILVHKMRLLLKRTSGAPSPDDGELRAYLE